MVIKIKETENRIFREWVKEGNLCGNSTKKEISNATSPANLTAGNDSVDIFLSDHNIRNEKGDTSSLDASSLTAAPSIPENQVPVTVADTSFLSAHNITNEDNIVKSDTMQRYAKKCKGDFNGYLEL